MLGATFGAGRLLKSAAPEAGGPRTAVAVLPFRNLSADSSYAYFAGGLHDELLTQLAKVASLRVIGRASVLGYEESSKPLRQIGELEQIAGGEHASAIGFEEGQDALGVGEVDAAPRH